jgi:two-component system, OmpR family, sensor kinase
VSLRLRLLLALIGLVAAGLVLAGSVTYFSLHSFLFTRVDQQVHDARAPVVIALQDQLGSGSGLPTGGGLGRALLPPGTFGELLDASNKRVGDPVTFGYGQATAAPILPAHLPTPSAGADSILISTGATAHSSLHYRVMIETLSDGRSHLVIAVPLTDTEQTLRTLVIAEIIITASILAALAVLASTIVRRGLRPLEAMGATATAIAAGDLSRRVEPADDRTEVGRLGLALNGMLEHIEHAFAERKASENRLRRFLADASHELRTPLTSIRGYAELFHRGAKDRPADLETAMRRIEQESKRMGVLVDELLLLARVDEGRPLDSLPVDLAPIAADAVQDARAAQSDRPITLTVPASLKVIGDEARLRQVAANLLGNALVHTPAGTPVDVVCDAQDGVAVLRVADQGPGLTAEQAEHVFDPFYRADPSRTRASGGDGLGLAIVAAVVRAHGGTVSVESEPEKGAAFIVKLPLPGDTAVTETSAAASDPAPADTDRSPSPAESPAATIVRASTGDASEDG